MVIALAFFGYKTLRFLKNIGVNSNLSLISKPKHAYTVALLGYGGLNHEGAYLTDTIIVGHVDYQTKKVLLISIPRDLWVKLPTKSGQPFAAKINTVYQLQLFPKTFPDVTVAKFTKSDPNGLIKKVLADVTGLAIDAYVAIDFDAFKTGVDAIGGIDVEIERSFIDNEYPIEGKEADTCGKEGPELAESERLATESPEIAFPCRYETISFTQGLTHLDGIQALKYARSRHAPEDGGDFRRARRQQKVIEAVTDKLLSPVFLPKIPHLFDQLETKIQTDASYADLTRLLKEAPQSSHYQVIKLILSDNNLLKTSYSADGQYILIPKRGVFRWAKIHQKVTLLAN